MFVFLTGKQKISTSLLAAVAMITGMLVKFRNAKPWLIKEENNKVIDDNLQILHCHPDILIQIKANSGACGWKIGKERGFEIIKNIAIMIDINTGRAKT